jgi:hypothetical protein
MTMTAMRTLLAKSTLAMLLAMGAGGAAHADIASFSTTIGGPADSGPANNGPAGNDPGNAGNNDGGGHGPDIFTYDTKLPNKVHLPKVPLLPKKPCHGSSCKVQTVSVEGKVCFYTGMNFTGAHFCASTGTSAPKLPATWNDRISSIEVIGPASVKICSDRVYSGECLALGGSRSMLISLDKAISSYRVTR